MSVDRFDDEGDRRPTAADRPVVRGIGDLRPPESTADQVDSAVRVARAVDYRATVDAAYRAYAVDQGCARVRETEETIVTPAMRRIESEDPTRHLAGFDHRLKEKDRLTEKVEFDMRKKGISASEAFAAVKDAIRYTFQYSEDDYARGVHSDCDRLVAAGFEFVERRNSWTHDEYKGINSRWRVPENGQLFEVQFHTRASFEAKESTHWAYEKLRVGAPMNEQQELKNVQRDVTARIPLPPGASDIPDYP